MVENNNTEDAVYIPIKKDVYNRICKSHMVIDDWCVEHYDEHSNLDDYINWLMELVLENYID